MRLLLHAPMHRGWNKSVQFRFDGLDRTCCGTVSMQSINDNIILNRIPFATLALEWKKVELAAKGHLAVAADRINVS